MPNIQFKELGEGRVFYRSGNRVFTGRLDLTHMAEGYGRYTVSGTGNTAYQWASHALDAMHERDPRAVLKYLERLDADLMKGRDLARLAGDSPVQGKLRDLIARLRANPGAATVYADDIMAALHKAQLEARLMQKLGSGGMVGSALARVLLEGREGAGRLWTALSDASEHVPAGLIIEGIFRAWMAHGAAMAVAEEDMVRIYTAALGAIPGLALTPALMAELVAATLEAARSGGYDLVASTQDANDLLAGIYTGVGRAGTDDRAYTIDDLVKHLWTEEQLRCFVYARCVAAAARGFGDVTGRDDMGSAEAIFEKCYPVILRAWQSKREMLAAEFYEQCDQIAQDVLLAVYSPTPALLVAAGRRRDRHGDGAVLQQGRRLERFRTILRTLLGPKAKIYANVHNTWTPAGKDTGKSDGSVTYTFNAPRGKHVVKLEQTVSLGAANLPLRSPLVRDITRRTAVEIDVTDGQGGTPGTGGVWVLAKRTVVKTIEPSRREKTNGNLREVHETTANSSETSLDCSYTYTGERPKAEVHGSVLTGPKTWPRLLQTKYVRRATWSALPSQLQPGMTINLSLSLSNAGSVLVCDPPGADGSETDVMTQGAMSWFVYTERAPEQPQTGTGNIPPRETLLRLLVNVQDRNKQGSLVVPTYNADRPVLMIEVFGTPGLPWGDMHRVLYEYRFQPAAVTPKAP